MASSPLSPVRTPARPLLSDRDGPQLANPRIRPVWGLLETMMSTTFGPRRRPTIPRRTFGPGSLCIRTPRRPRCAPSMASVRPAGLETPSSPWLPEGPARPSPVLELVAVDESLSPNFLRHPLPSETDRKPVPAAGAHNRTPTQPSEIVCALACARLNVQPSARTSSLTRRQPRPFNDEGPDVTSPRIGTSSLPHRQTTAERSCPGSCHRRRNSPSSWRPVSPSAVTIGHDQQCSCQITADEWTPTRPSCVIEAELELHMPVAITDRRRR